MPYTSRHRFQLLRLLLITLACAALVPLVAAESSHDETSIMVAASTPGPGRVKAIRQLGEKPPQDPVAVARVLVDGLLASDVACSIEARIAVSGLLRQDEQPSAFGVAMTAHAERLVQAAEARMSGRINGPLEVLASIHVPSGPLTSRLLGLLAPGKPFRRLTVSALARSRPLTDEIRVAVLAEAGGAPLTQQDLVIAMTGWSADDLSGDAVEGALIRLFGGVMGNVPPYVVQVLGQRGKQSPRFAGRMREILADMVVPDERFRNALDAHVVAADPVEHQLLISSLLASDPRQDASRFLLVIEHCERVGLLAPAIKQRLAVVLQDEDLMWWFRHRCAIALARHDPADKGLVPLITASASLPEWVIGVDSASG